MTFKESQRKYTPNHTATHSNRKKPTWVLLPMSYCIIDERKSDQPFKHVMAQFDLMHSYTQFVVCGVRQMLYNEGHVFLLPFYWDVYTKNFVNAVKFRNRIASDLFQYEVAGVIRSHLSKLEGGAPSHIYPTLPEKVVMTVQQQKEKNKDHRLAGANGWSSRNTK